MKFCKNKKFYVSILIDFSFLLILYYFLVLIIQKIKSYALILQDFGLDMAKVESIIEENMSMFDYSLIMNNLEKVNAVMHKISLLFLILLIGSFLIYCLFQSVNWSYILRVKFKKYFWKFCLVSLFSFSLSLLFLWFILLNIKSLMVNYSGNLPLFGFIIKILLLFILLFVLGYYTHVCYILLAKNKVVDALKKTFKFKNLKSILTSLGLFLLIIGIIILFLMLNLTGLFLIVVMLFLILFVWNYCRYNLIRILKEPKDI